MPPACSECHFRGCIALFTIPLPFGEGLGVGSPFSSICGRGVGREVFPCIMYRRTDMNRRFRRRHLHKNSVHRLQPHNDQHTDEYDN